VPQTPQFNDPYDSYYGQGSVSGASGFYGQPQDQANPVDHALNDPQPNYQNTNTAYGYAYEQPPQGGTLEPYTPPTPLSYVPAPEHPQSTSVLILGILGLFLFPPLSFIALVMGGKARRQIRESPGRWSDSGQLTAGWVMGIIGSTLTSLAVLFIMAVLFFAILATMMA